MLLHGLTLVTMFAPMHECTHRTAFAAPRANAAVGWVAGLVSFNNSTFYRYYHSWHHRYMQDPARDPELMFPRASSRSAYLREISTIGFWHRRTVDYIKLARGAVRLQCGTCRSTPSTTSSRRCRFTACRRFTS